MLCDKLLLQMYFKNLLLICKGAFLVGNYLILFMEYFRQFCYYPTFTVFLLHLICRRITR